LTPEQACVIREAEKCLASDERERIVKGSLSQEASIQQGTMHEPKSKPTESNGKGIDPRNWGTLDVSEDKLDVEAQRFALASWNFAHQLANESESDGPEPSNKG
ncbi:hypothetical protein BKA83DRAFT_4021624, partial [Pisolithus microcarpus]